MRVLYLPYSRTNTYVCRFFQNFLVWSSLKYFEEYLPEDSEYSVETPVDYGDNFTDNYYKGTEDMNDVETVISVSPEEYCLSKTIETFSLFFISTVAVDRASFKVKEVYYSRISIFYLN